MKNNIEHKQNKRLYIPELQTLSKQSFNLNLATDNNAANLWAVARGERDAGNLLHMAVHNRTSLKEHLGKLFYK